MVGISHDILETLDDFIASASDSNIQIEVIDLYGKEKIKAHQPLIVHDEETA